MDTKIEHSPTGFSSPTQILQAKFTYLCMLVRQKSIDLFFNFIDKTNHTSNTLMACLSEASIQILIFPFYELVEYIEQLNYLSFRE